MSELEIQDVTKVLRNGKPAIYPTDTVYGLGVAVAYTESPRELFELKGRPDTKPVAWLVAGTSALDTYGSIVPEYAQRLARQFWPGPLTLIVKASDEVPSAYQSAQGTLGMRMPASRIALELINALDCPLATTSANPSGKAAPKCCEDIDKRLAAQVAVLATPQKLKLSGVASTVVDCTGPAPIVVRGGDISAAQVEAAAWDEVPAGGRPPTTPTTAAERLKA